MTPRMSSENGLAPVKWHGFPVQVSGAIDSECMYQKASTRAKKHINDLVNAISYLATRPLYVVTDESVLGA